MSVIHDDLIERSVNIHWPDGYDPGNADRFARNAIIIIDAPAENIWTKRTKRCAGSPRGRGGRAWVLAAA
jgi:hypothetical protein